jgi:hypothetical protein
MCCVGAQELLAFARLLAALRERDFVSPQRMSDRLRLPLAELAKLAHVHRNTLAQRPDSPVVQKGLEPVVRILAWPRS